MTTKFRINLACILSLAGILLSVALLILHLNPEFGGRFIMCGSGMINPCLAVSLSPYSRVFGFPVAGIGLAFYLFILFTLLVADYADGDYPVLAPVFLLPFTIAALIGDAVLAIGLIKLKTMCALCISTYLVNVLLIVLFFIHLVDIRRQGIAPLNAARDYLSRMLPDRKAALSSFILFILFLLFSVFISVRLMETGHGEKSVTQGDIDRFLKKFLSTDVEKIDLPETPIVLGDKNAPVEIIVFTDFLCTACSELYSLERYLFTLHGKAVKISIYHYPLDSNCNSDVKRTIYKSCPAARAVTASALMNLHEQYIISHYRDISKFRKNYTDETAFSIFADSLGKIRDKNEQSARFRTLLNSAEIDKILKDHTDAAIKLKIDSTPTFFIAGRRLTGVPPFQYMEALVRGEMSK